MEQEAAETPTPTTIPHWRQVYDSAGITDEVKLWNYSGSGTEDDPYAVTWIENDPRNPMLYSNRKRWSIIIVPAMVCSPVCNP